MAPDLTQQTSGTTRHNVNGWPDSGGTATSTGSLWPVAVIRINVKTWDGTSTDPFYQFNEPVAAFTKAANQWKERYREHRLLMEGVERRARQRRRSKPAMPTLAKRKRSTRSQSSAWMVMR